MTTIQVTVSGKVAICRKQYLISSNADYCLSFTFDDDWDVAGVKTARLLFDGQSCDLVFTGTTVALPKLPACEELAVGVFTDTIASTIAQIGCIRSVADVDADPVSTFTESQYDQIVALLNNADLRQIDTVTRVGNTLQFAFRDGTTMSVPVYDGVSVTAATVAQDGTLFLSFSDGQTRSAGIVRGPKGDKGDPFTFNDFTDADKNAVAAMVLSRLLAAEGGQF